jgi:phosphatidylglycerol lysyltransferase
MGDPVGPEDAQRELVWEFLDLVDDYGGRAAFYEVDATRLPLYVDAGLTLVKLGEEARVNLADFSLEGSARKAMRNNLNRLAKEGCTFAVVPAAEVPALLPELRRISDAWLAIKNTREKGFSLGFFRDDYVSRCAVGVVYKDGKPVAFANLWQNEGKQETSIDLMRFHPDAPAGVMEYLFTNLILAAKADNVAWFNLGMAPLSGLENRAAAPLWDRVGSFLYEQGERLYNFQGLRDYKNKFRPEWEPKYLATTSALRLPLTLADIAVLISGGMRGLISK